ncbi:MAG: hypothetical protein AAGI91_07130 [Bacteroidota bacterium]
MLRPLVLLALLAAAPLAAQPVTLTEYDTAAYGATEFENSGSDEAQGPFLRGLLMLHSFEYEDAREAFQEARRVDPDFALAAWGEALTHNHPIWQQQDRDAAIAALGDLWTAIERGAPLPGATEREADYLRTLGVLYGDGSKEARDLAYANALGTLADRYPGDLDAAAFHALAVLGTAHDGRDFGIYMRAAAIAEEVFNANPDHPGAAHYLIHAYDDPVHAPLGLRAARVYAEIAPAASHALHMPSHIHFALGMWDEGAEMNRRSYEAAQARADRRGDPLNGHGWHALQWLAYAELQRGRFDEASRLLALSEDLAEGQARRSYAPVLLRAHVLVNTEDWDGPLAHTAPDLADESLTVSAQSLFADGWAALERGDRAAAEAFAAALRERLDTDGDPDPEDRVPEAQLQALLALDEGATDEALAFLQEAAELEDAMPLDFGPALPIKPAHELFGEVLLDLDRPDEARQQFEHALARYPRRSRSLLGLARAAMEAGGTEMAREAYADLAAAWHAADAHPALAEVRAHAAMEMQ